MTDTFDLSQHDYVGITAEYVLAQLDDVLIFRYYLGDFQLGVKQSSPLRSTKKPKLSITLNPNWMKLQYKDWGTGEVGDCFKFVSRLYGLTYNQAIERVACDFGLVKGCEIVTKKQIQEARKFKESFRKDYLIQVKPRKMGKAELAYWQQYGITSEELTKEFIYAIDTIWVNKKQFHLKGGLHFAYHFPKVDKFKIYSPDAKDWKWFGNVSAFELEGVENLILKDYTQDGKEFPGPAVIITKSRKDRLILQKLYKNVCNCQNEAETSIPKEFDTLFNECEAKFCWFDTDEAGKSANRALNHRGYKWINVPNNLYDKYGLKDPADVMKHFGKEGEEILLNELRKKQLVT